MEANIEKVDLRREPRVIEFRKEPFEITHHSYFDPIAKLPYTNAQLDSLNTSQVHNQYRQKYGIPFTEEIIALRERYGVSAAKMGAILGLGTNVYKSYEHGEIPSPSNGKLIQLAKLPDVFLELLALSRKELGDLEADKIRRKTEDSLRMESTDILVTRKIINDNSPTVVTGFKKADFDRIGQMVKFLTMTSKVSLPKLNSLLYQSDFLHYSNFGFGISGMMYMYLSEFGPAPRHCGSIYDLLFEYDYFNVVSSGDTGSEQFVNNNIKPSMDKFRESELRVLQTVVREHAATPTEQDAITSMPPQQDKTIISYNTAFSGHFPHI
ncbi:hypothetical protein ACWKWU_07865 [Chitinophaga lutea]